MTVFELSKNVTLVNTNRCLSHSHYSLHKRGLINKLQSVASYEYMGYKHLYSQAPCGFLAAETSKCLKQRELAAIVHQLRVTGTRR